MGRFLRWGNWAVAKMTELLFNTTILTDMGCTYRLFRREALQLLRPHLTIGGSHFGPQLLMEVVAHKIPFVEIPVNYRQRVGKSSVTGDFGKAFRLGIQMILLVLQYRLGLFRKPRVDWDQTWDVAPARRYSQPDPQPHVSDGLIAVSRTLGTGTHPAVTREPKVQTPQ